MINYMLIDMELRPHWLDLLERIRDRAVSELATPEERATDADVGLINHLILELQDGRPGICESCLYRSCDPTNRWSVRLRSEYDPSLGRAEEWYGARVYPWASVQLHGHWLCQRCWSDFTAIDRIGAGQLRSLLDCQSKIWKRDEHRPGSNG